MPFKQLVKSVIDQTPYRIRRAQRINRFEAFEDGLRSLKLFGFSPSRVIDAGANVGNFTKMIWRHFPSAYVDLIEPQPNCAAPLKALSRVGRGGGSKLWPVALVGPGATGDSVGFAVQREGITTGAKIAGPGQQSSDSTIVKVKTSTLDSLLGDDLSSDDHVLLKLDLEGHELEAMQGACRVLDRTEVVITETTLIGNPSPLNSPLKLASYMDSCGFDLYDIFSISGRPRDGRARQFDLVFVKRGRTLDRDRDWN